MKIIASKVGGLIVIGRKRHLSVFRTDAGFTVCSRGFTAFGIGVFICDNV